MNIEQIRRHYPALSGDTVLLENAGGSQVPTSVADAIRDHLLQDYCQLGAGYPASDRATATVERAHRFMDRFVNGEGLGRVVLGSSCTSLMHVLAHAIGRTIEPGDEIVVCEQGHEANIGCWTELERLGAVVRWWTVDHETGSLSLKDLDAVLSNRTRIVAFPHVSNLLGEIVDVKGATELAHRHGAKVVVDGVAYAPHRAIDVRRWNVDFYAWSTYKVYGPHMGALFGRFDAFEGLQGPNHFFIPDDELPYKFELGGASHEGCAGLCALAPILGELAGHGNSKEIDAENCSYEIVEKAFETMTALESPLQAHLLERLRRHEQVRIIGPTAPEISARVSTISFLHFQRDSEEIVAAARNADVGIRHGHMYAYRLCKAMGIDLQSGVVRVSAVHYNTMSEIDRLMDAIDPMLAETNIQPPGN
ncbi:MAG: cysteine desulfurase-like protein [Phycisphaerae bacterium]|nr:cysteine desulfurase-like protein [Phycisphaerae bacterium]